MISIEDHICNQLHIGINSKQRFIHADYRFDIGGYESYIGPEGDNKGSDFLTGSSKISASIGFVKNYRILILKCFLLIDNFKK